MHVSKTIRPQLFAIGLIVLNAASAAAQPEAPKKYALLIGLNKYMSTSVADLTCARKDVDDLKIELDKQGFEEVVPLKDHEAERNKIVAHLSRIATRLRQQDIFLLYFAGHGVRSKIGKTPTYWLTYDANIEQLDVAGIRLVHLFDYIADIKAKQKIVILDHCFSGDVVFKRGSGETGARGPESGTVELVESTARGGIPNDVFNSTVPSAGSGTLVIAAARGYAYELPTGNGVLTTALLKALKSRDADTDKDRKLSAIELVPYIRTQVKDLSKQKQEAQVWFEQGTNIDEWVVAENLPVDNAEAKKLADTYLDLLARWNSKELLSLDDFRDGAQMLEIWVASFGTGRPLAPHERASMDSFRQVAADQNGSDAARVALAKALIHAFFGR